MIVIILCPARDYTCIALPQEVGCTAIKWNIPLKSRVDAFYMADPNSTTGLKFYKNFCPGGPLFHGILVPWTNFFRTKIPLTGPEDTRIHNLQFFSYNIITYRLFFSAKTDAEICHTYLRIKTDSGQLAFCFCGPLVRRQEAYSPALRLYKEHAHKLEYECPICYSCEL